jgi:hypothetical protein
MLRYFSIVFNLFLLKVIIGTSKNQNSPRLYISKIYNIFFNFLL